MSYADWSKFRNNEEDWYIYYIHSDTYDEVTGAAKSALDL